MKYKIIIQIALVFSLIQSIITAQPRFGNNIQLKTKVRVNKLMNGFYQYIYNVSIDPDSRQPLISYTIEISISSMDDYKNILIDSQLIRNWGCSKLAQPSVKPQNFAGAEVTWIPLDTLAANSNYDTPPTSSIMPGDSIIFHLITQSLPIIGRYWAQGWYEPYTEKEIDSLIKVGYTETELFKPWYSDAATGLTLCSYFPPTDLSFATFLDTLLSNTERAFELNWISSIEKRDMYLTLLSNAKTALQQNNISLARTNLQNILHVVNIDSSGAITSEAYALLRYNTEYLLSKLPRPPSGMPVKLINSTGTKLPGGSLQYYEGGWKNAVDNGDGTFTVNTQLKNVSLRMTYEYGTQTKSNVDVSSDTVVFQTVNTVVQLKNSQGNFIDQGTVQYYSGGWRDFGTTVNGIVTKELLPNNYTFRMSYEFVSNDKAQNIGTNNTVVFSTVLCTVNVKNQQNHPVNNATVRYYSGGWRDFGTTTNGTATKELLPANLTFQVNYNNTQQEKTQNIATNNVVEFGL